MAFRVATEEADNPELKQVMQDSLNYANSLLKDRQDKMQDLIRQTSQNYLKEKLFAENDKKYVDKYFWNGKRMTPFEAIAFDNERKKIIQEIYCLYFTDETYEEIIAVKSKAVI